jgi:allantoinase
VIDLIVAGGRIVMDGTTREADLAVDDGRIVGVGSNLGEARTRVDASGLVVMPGMIDVHLHFNEPGRTHWEGAATGSRALAAGGGTLYFDMPLNSTPCTIDVDAFDRKHDALRAASITDFAIWGGLVPGAVPNMAAMAERGVVGFKAFMCDSGLPEFPRADDRTLFDGLREAARLGLPVAVHAENEELSRTRARADENDARAWARSRPLVAELDAIQRAVLLAGEAGAALHIVHVSSGRGVEVAADARRRGVNVSIETCPHYLAFTEDDLERLGTLVKCAPPLREGTAREALWAYVADGTIDIVASDHSPTDPALKQTAFASAWGGIAGVQSTLPVMLDLGHRERGLALERVVQLVAATPARRFGIARKGAIVVGADADLVLVDLRAQFTLGVDDLQQRHKLSPYVGHTFAGVVRRTIRRGETIFADGRIPDSATRGRLLRPDRHA